MVDYSDYQSWVVLMASSNTETASSALLGADAGGEGGAVWRASVDDVDDDGDYVYSVQLTASDVDDEHSYLATLSVHVANVDVIMLYVQCRERPGRWSVATSPVRHDSCHITYRVPQKPCRWLLQVHKVPVMPDISQCKAPFTLESY